MTYQKLQNSLIIRNSTNFKKTVLVVGVFHGDEPQGEFFINKYIKTCFKNGEEGKNRVFFIPRLNKADTRTNPAGVDLNRNFPTKNWEFYEKCEYWGGECAASEEETKFLVSLIEENDFDAVITIHAPYKIINYDGDQSLTLAKEISNILGYPVQRDIGYPTPGSFGTYCGIERKIPAITIEVDEEINPKLLADKFCKLFTYLENM